MLGRRNMHFTTSRSLIVLLEAVTSDVSWIVAMTATVGHDTLESSVLVPCEADGSIRRT